jgi:hypothetical protein
MKRSTYTADFLAAQEIISRYWAMVDGKLNAPVELCFTNNCIIKIGGLEISGRDRLVKSILARSQNAAQQDRSTRHMVSNIVVTDCSTNHLTFDSLLTVFSGYGEKPAPLRSPSSIGDFTYYFTKAETGEWKISRLEGVIIFAGSDSPFSRQAAHKAQE